MAIDANIPLGIRPPQLDDPLTVQTKQLQLRDLMGQQQTHQMQLEDAQRARQTQMTLADIYRESGGDPTKTRELLAQRGQGAQIPAFDKDRAATGKVTTETDAAKYKLMSEQLDDSNRGMAALLSDPQLSAQKVVQFLASRAQMFPDQSGRLAEVARTLPPDPGQLRQVLLQKAMEGLKAKEQLDLLLPKTGTIDAGNRVIPTQTNQLTGQMGQGAPIVKAPEGFTVGVGGRLTADPGFLDAKRSIAAAGKTAVNLNVNTAKGLTGEMATGLGKQLDSSLAGAQSAAATISTADQIRRLAGSGKVITGPGADARVVVARIGDALGVTGADAKEKLANTAALVQNLAKTELEAAQAMKGQGQITESERAILRRAASGDLNMTPSELMSLAGGLDKTARTRIRQHKEQVKRMGSLEGAAPLMPFYNVDEPPAGAPTAPPSDGWTVTPVK